MGSLTSKKPRHRRTLMAVGGIGAVLAMALSACSSSPTASGSSGSSTPPPPVETSGGGSSSAAGTPSGEPYVIGNLMEIQTPFGTYPASYQGTVKAWEAWTNDHGGINGRPVKVISIDDQADAAKSLAAAKKLVEDDKVIALAGLANPSSESAYEDYLTKAGVPVVGSAYSTIAAKNPNWFQTGVSSYDVTGYSRALAAKDAGIKNYGLMYCTEVPACKVDVDTQKAAAQKLGGPNIAVTLSAAIASPNFTAQCLQLKGKKVDAYYFSSAISGIAHAAVDCARQGLKAMHVMGESAPEFLKTKQVWENGAVGADMSVPFWADLPESADYHAAMKAQGITELSAASAQVWAAFEVLKAALEKVPDDPATPATVKKGLYLLPDGFKPDMGIPVHYKEGQASVVKCFYMWKINNGKYELSHGSEATCMP
jgi:branched-chain amino acid transport system substrate-binding protein